MNSREHLQILLLTACLSLLSLYLGGSLRAADPDFWIKDCNGHNGQPEYTACPWPARYWGAPETYIANWDSPDPAASFKRGVWNRLWVKVHNQGDDGEARVYGYYHRGRAGLRWPTSALAGGGRIINDRRGFCEEETPWLDCEVYDPALIYSKGDVNDGEAKDFEWFWKMPFDMPLHYCLGFVINPLNYGDDDCLGLDCQRDDRPEYDDNVAQVNVQELIKHIAGPKSGGAGGQTSGQDLTFHTSWQVANPTGSDDSFFIDVELGELTGCWTHDWSPRDTVMIPADSAILVDIWAEVSPNCAFTQWESDTVSIRITPIDNTDSTLGGGTTIFRVDNNPPLADFNLEWLCTADMPNCCPPPLMEICGKQLESTPNFVPLEWDVPTVDVNGYYERLLCFYVYRSTEPGLTVEDLYDSVAMDITLDAPRFQYIDPDVDSCQTYYYAVAAVDGADNVSEMSNVVEVSRCLTACGARPTIDPDPMYAYMAYAISPIPGTAYLKPSVLPSGFSLADINVATLVLNGSVTPTQAYLEGDQMNIDFDVREFVQSYGAIWGISDRLYTVSGEFLDGTPFSFSCTVTLIGHRMADVNLDGEVNVADLSYLVDYLFAGGEAPPMPQTADLNCDGSVNIADLSLLVSYLFNFGPEPTPCGLSPTSRVREKRSDVSINSMYEDGATIVSLESAVNIRGVQFDLVGEGDSEPVKLADEKLELLSHRLEDTVRIGILDLNGSAVITKGVQPLVRLPGRFEIIDALVSDIDHFAVAPAINPAVAKPDLPVRFSLYQNHPNPFNPTTEIRFDLPNAVNVRLDIYNIVGQRVTTLLDEHLEAGQHTVTWDGSSVASGVYLYRLQAGSFVQTRKMMLIK